MAKVKADCDCPCSCAASKDVSPKDYWDEIEDLYRSADVPEGVDYANELEREAKELASGQLDAKTRKRVAALLRAVAARL